MFEGFIEDFRHALRSLARAPRFTIMVGTTLALAIGANTAIFSAVNGILLKPLPFRDADRIVGINSTAPGLGYPQFGISAGVFYIYQEEIPLFEDMGLYQGFDANLTNDGTPETVSAVRTSASTFTTLGVSPLRGRIQSAEEDLPQGPPIALISHALWERRFDSDPDILGRSLTVDGEVREVIGVMPPSFRFPGERRDLWIPAGIDPEAADPGSFSWNAIGRIKPGLSPLEVQTQMGAVASRIPERYPGDDAQSLRAFFTEGEFAPLLEPLREAVIGDVRAPLWILLGTVGFVLLIACANVANLLLVRTEGRQKELAVRAALGAGRKRLLGHYFAESALLAGLGGTGGLLLAWMGIPALLRAAPPTLPRLDQIGLDPSVLVFCLGITGLSALLFGLIPVARYTGAPLLESLKHGARGSSAGRESHRARSSLVVAQTALALVLLVGSGLMVRSFWEIRNTDPGFDASGVLTFRISLPGSDYPDPLSTAQFHQQLLDRLGGLPGVEAVGAASNLPMGESAQGTAFVIEDFPTPAGELPPLFWYKWATAGYFEALGIPLLSGRTFSPSDHETDLGNIVINEVIADRYWPDEGAIGKRIRFSSDTAGWYQVVGVVGQTKERGLREDPIDHIYFPMVARTLESSWRTGSLAYAVKGQNPVALAPTIREEIWARDNNLPIAAMKTMDEILSSSVVRLTFTMLALALASGMALVLGAVGLFGVLSYVVTQRTREIGIRMALGAEGVSVLRLVVGHGARIAGVGVILGLLGAGALTRLLQSLLFETAPLDPVVLGGMSALLFGVALTAAYIPARRASRVDPVQALRAE